MFDVYKALRGMNTKASTTVDIHKSGFKVKLEGAPEELSDAGLLDLLKGQKETDGRLNTKVSGKTTDTEGHKAQVSFPNPVKDELVAVFEGKYVTGTEEGDQDLEAANPRQEGETTRAYKKRLKAIAEELKASRNGVPEGANS